jgi:vacuolar-type H+-ATPase subunit I/STV1
MNKLGWLLIGLGVLMLLKGSHVIVPLLFAPLFFWPFFIVPLLFMMGGRHHHAWQHGCHGGCGRAEQPRDEVARPKANTGKTVQL